jgi:hypothetical protein
MQGFLSAVYRGSDALTVVAIIVFVVSIVMLIYWFGYPGAAVSIHGHHLLPCSGRCLVGADEEATKRGEDRATNQKLGRCAPEAEREEDQRSTGEKRDSQE